MTPRARRKVDVEKLGSHLKAILRVHVIEILKLPDTGVMVPHGLNIAPAEYRPCCANIAQAQAISP